MIQAVILAAESALRVPLIGLALDSLVEAGVKDALVVTRTAGDAIETYLARRFDLNVAVVEHRDGGAGTLAAVAAVAHLIDDDFLLIDGDLRFEPALVSRLLGPGTRLAVDPSRALDDDAVKVAAEGERIVSVGTCLAPFQRPAGESIGMAKIDLATGERLFVVARRLLDAGLRHLRYEAAFEALIDEGEVFEMTDITGLRWTAQPLNSFHPFGDPIPLECPPGGVPGPVRDLPV